MLYFCVVRVIWICGYFRKCLKWTNWVLLWHSKFFICGQPKRSDQNRIWFQSRRLGWPVSQCVLVTNVTCHHNIIFISSHSKKSKLSPTLHLSLVSKNFATKNMHQSFQQDSPQEFDFIKPANCITHQPVPYSLEKNIIISRKD